MPLRQRVQTIQTPNKSQGQIRLNENHDSVTKNDKKSAFKKRHRFESATKLERPLLVSYM